MDFKSNRGTVMIWFIVATAIVFVGLMQIIFLCVALPDKHSVDNALEAGALAGASNVVDESIEDVDTMEKFDLETADSEAKYLISSNLAINGLTERISIESFSSEIEENMYGDKWYKVKIRATIKVVSMLPFVPRTITYNTTAHAAIVTQ